MKVRIFSDIFRSSLSSLIQSYSCILVIAFLEPKYFNIASNNVPILVICTLTILTGTNFILLNSEQEFSEIKACLLQRFFICLNNQLSSTRPSRKGNASHLPGLIFRSKKWQKERKACSQNSDIPHTNSSIYFFL